MGGVLPKITFLKEGDNMVSTIDCTPAELLGAIQTLVGTFAESAGIPYNEVLDDLKDAPDANRP